MGWTWAAGVSLRHSECCGSPNPQAQRAAGGAGPGERRREAGRESVLGTVRFVYGGWGGCSSEGGFSNIFLNGLSFNSRTFKGNLIYTN